MIGYIRVFYMGHACIYSISAYPILLTVLFVGFLFTSSEITNSNRSSETGSLFRSPFVKFGDSNVL